jgi:glutamine kinase
MAVGGVVVQAGSATPWAGKAGTLQRLAGRLRHSVVPQGLVLSRRDWQQRELWLARLRREFDAAAVAVRSSGAEEDGALQSQAGRYLTRLDVDSADAVVLATAIDAVFASYGSSSANDQVFVQAMVRAQLAAVAATHAIEDGADYYAFSLAAGARTDAVTRGDVAVRTVYLAHEAPPPEQPELALLHRALLELREHCGAQPLEAELVLSGLRVVLLQVRPLLLRSTPRSGAVRRRQLANEQRTLLAVTPGCAGQRRVLALMPDWNTAELLGSHPRPLALALFRLAIADAAWRNARRALGYRALREVALLQPLAGRPYVDVRASANSLLPQALDPASAARVADAWQQRLLDSPTLHDRYEFAVAQTCVDFDFDAQWRERYDGVLDAAALRRYRSALATITARCLAPSTLDAALARLHRLDRPLHAGDQALAEARQRLPREGGFAFALIARLAFVFEALLRSALTRGALQPERLLQLQRSCSSVTRQFLRAVDGPHPFGFLRAGTFEITTPSLDSMTLAATAAPAGSTDHDDFAPTPAERRALDSLLQECGYALDARQLLHGYRRTRESRELAKYRLSAAVSQLLEHIAAHGARRGLDRDTLSWLDLDLACAAEPSAAVRAVANRAVHAADAGLRLPTVLDPMRSLQQVEIAAGTPTFVGSTRAAAPLVVVDMQTRPAALPPRAIVAIASADPGYDWIFAQQPAGLITAFGGPNSHMAIRCAELGVPAVLGLGWERWQRLAQARWLEIDTQAQAATPWTPA